MLVRLSGSLFVCPPVYPFVLYEFVGERQHIMLSQDLALSRLVKSWRMTVFLSCVWIECRRLLDSESTSFFATPPYVIRVSQPTTTTTQRLISMSSEYADVCWIVLLEIVS